MLRSAHFSSWTDSDPCAYIIGDLKDRAAARGRSAVTIEEMLHHPTLVTPMHESEGHVGAAAGLYERVLREHGVDLETTAGHRKMALDNLHEFRFHATDDDQHYARRTAFYTKHYPDHPHAQGRA